MQRHKTSAAGRGRRPTGARSARWWADIARPAVLIALVGSAAIVHISACARVSIIEWDLCVLQAESAERQAVALDLQRRISEFRTASLVRDHVSERGLTKEAAVAQVDVDELPTELIAELPGAMPEQVAEASRATAEGERLIAAAPPAR
ncbi:MAG TPA: hypothetical protein VM283_00530 [Armatimonadota bacterium]|nr:hypothetical protein [Armatimonadota bacterium]